MIRCFRKATNVWLVAGFARNPVQWTSPQLWASSLSVLFPTKFLKARGQSALLPALMCHQQTRELASTVKASSGSCSRSNRFARDQLLLMQVYHHVMWLGIGANIFGWQGINKNRPPSVADLSYFESHANCQLNQGLDVFVKLGMCWLLFVCSIEMVVTKRGT